MSICDSPDPPDPNPEEERAHYERQQAMKSPVSITGLTVESMQMIIEGAVEAQFRSQYGEYLRERFDRAIEAKIHLILDDVARDNVADRIGDEVDRALDLGFQAYNPYSGKPDGKVVTLREMVEDLLNRPSNGKASLVATAVEEATKKAVTADFPEVIAAAKKKLADTVDELLRGEFTKAMKAALGIR